MTAPIDPHVDYRVEASIPTITLDRPEKLNAVTFTMADAIVEHLDQATVDPAVRVVVLQGAGDAFTTGIDIEDHLEEQSPGEKDFDADRADIARAAERWLRLWSCPKPIIVKAHGWCAAWGLEIAMHADIVLASEDCRFFFPSVRNGAGLPDSATAVYHLGPQWAKRLLFSGEIIDGRTAERIGLVCQAYPTGELDAAVDDLARRIAAIPSELVSQSKAVINQRIELMGRPALQSFAEHANATARRDPDVALFGQIMQRDGKAAAIAWREARLRA
jgi:enoyl-CoA hydratase